MNDENMITISKIKRVSKELKKLPEKSKKEYKTVKEIVEALSDDIEEMRKKGYTNKDIADVLSKLGVKITYASIAMYAKSKKTSKKENISQAS